MKIAFLTNTFPGVHKRVGGGEQACLRIAMSLINSGYKVDVITTISKIKKIKEYSVKTIYLSEDFMLGLGKIVEILKWYFLQFDILVFIQCYFLFKREKYNIIHFHNCYKITFTPIVVAKLLNIPVILSIYDYWYFCPTSILSNAKDGICEEFHGKHCIKCLPNKLTVIQKLFLRIRKKIFDKYLNLVDKFIVLSDSSRKILLNYGINEKKVAKVQVEIPSEFKSFSNMETSKKNEVLFLGWLQYRKGLHIVLEAMDEVWKEMPHMKLIMLVQDVKWEKEYKRLIEKKIGSIDDSKYEFYNGHQSRDFVEKKIKEAAVIVVAEQWANMSPLVMIEAMFLGKAIVASKIGGIPEFIEHGKSGLLSTCDSPNEFADNILQALRNISFSKKLGQNAKEKIIGMQKKNDPLKKIIEVYSYYE